MTDIDGLPYAVFLTPGILATAAMNSASFETTFGAPLTHAVRLCRGLVTGAPGLALVADAVWLLVVAAGAFVLAERLVRRRLIL